MADVNEERNLTIRGNTSYSNYNTTIVILGGGIYEKITTDI
jgi:hypothetical protein